MVRLAYPLRWEGVDRTSSSVGAVLFKEGASEIVPKLGWECQHVGQGRPL
jgi:hypothetical protein